MVERKEGKDYARAWLKKEVPAVNLGPGAIFPAIDDVISVLREEPSLAEQFINASVDARDLHDTFILEKVKDGYDTYYVEYGKKKGLVHHQDVWAALAHHLGSLGL